MKLLLLAVVAGACLFGAALVSAQTPTPAPQTPPFSPDKQYSAEETITAAGGSCFVKSYYDNGKVRSEMSANGMNMISIIRPDQDKMYRVMPTQKMVMETPMTADVKQKMAATNGDEAKFEVVGPDTINSVACTKYKMTASNGQVMLWWVNEADKRPVRIAAPDGTMTIDFKNYKAGPQDASLFEPPSSYQVVNVPVSAGQ